MTDLAVLNRAAQVALDDCEQRIERGLKTFVEVGLALTAIRDNKLYRGTHTTFEAYCRERWNLTPQHANRLAMAAGVVTSMEPIGSIPAPSTESQARALAKVPEPERAEVWRETVERTEGKPTAAAVRAVHEERTQSPGPSDAAASPPVDPGANTEETPSVPVVPPPGSPATWTPEQVEANRIEIQRKQIIAAARRHARTIVTTVVGEVTTVVSGVDLGEHGLITEEMVTELQSAVDLLASRLEVHA